MGNRTSDSGECSYQRKDDEHEKLIETTTKKGNEEEEGMQRFYDYITVADLSGDARDVHPPGGQNSFIFMQFSTKKIGSHTHFGSCPPSPRENPGSATALESKDW